MNSATPALPSLRPDVEIVPGPDTAGGAPTWQLHDPLRALAVRIGWLEYECLRRWHRGEAAAIADAVSDATPLSATSADVEALAGFLDAHELVQRAAPRPEAPNDLWTLLNRWLRPLVFHRFRVLRPEPLLDGLRRVGAPVADRRVFIAVIALGVVALLLAIGDGARAQLPDPTNFAPRTIGLLLLAIVIAKTMHELGHGLAARAAGLRVPGMGIAFAFCMPLPYTEIADAFRCTRRRARLMISLGGIAAELVLASVALWLWLILPDGDLRDVALYVGTLAWLLSVLVNLNPFIRFDGYYALCDLLDLDNLQTRAFARLEDDLGLLCFGLSQRVMNEDTPRLRRLLRAYAIGAVIWRVLLYVGIGWLAAQWLPASLATMLLSGGALLLVAQPVRRSLTNWRNRGATLHPRPVLWIALIAALWFLLWPRAGHLVLPAVATPAGIATIHLEAPARAESLLVADGQWLDAGAELACVSDPELDNELQRTQVLLADLSARAGQRAAPGASAIVDAAEIAAVRSRLNELEQREARQTIRAAVTGRVDGISPDFVSGTWFDVRAPLLRIVPDEAPVLRAWAPTGSAHEMDVTAQALFFPYGSLAAGKQAAAVLAVTSLAPSSADARGGVDSTGMALLGADAGAVSLVELELIEGELPRGREIVGELRVATQPRSLLGRWIERFTGALGREFG